MEYKFLLTFIIPCYRSKNTIELVINEIINTVSQKDEYDYEIITINDCSPDDVLIVLKKLAEKDKKIKVIDLSKNMGKHSAMMAGFACSNGDFIIGLDDDGQCPLNELWNLLNPLQNGYDISIAKYGLKKQSLFKNFGSLINNEMAHYLIGKPRDLQLSNFFAIKKFIVMEILNYRNPYPYIDGLFLRSTQKITNVLMEDRERLDGKSTYSLKKLISQMLNGFTAFSVKPLRIATITGIVFAFSGFIYSLYIIIRKTLNPDVAVGWSSLMAIQLIIGGFILFMLGLIGEYIGRIYISINNSPQYVIRETININSEDKT